MQPARQGLKQNLGPFSLLVVVNAFVGAMVGLERSILPALAEEEFHLAAKVGVLSFIVVFGVTKAATNYAAGRLADAVGRKRVLVAGWLVAAPVPWILMGASSWTWVLVANVFLGVSQGLTWSTAVLMKIDLAGPRQRGLAMGFNEFAGYVAVAASAAATGWIAATWGLRPEPFYLGVVYVAVGLFLSAAWVRDTSHLVRLEASGPSRPDAGLSSREVFARTTFRDRDLAAVTQAGLVNNLNDGLSWGLFPLLFAASGLELGEVGLLVAVYPAVWGVGQLFTGGLSDRVGRRPLIVGGMFLQALGLVAVAVGQGVEAFLVGQLALGVGTAMVYPTLLAAISDVAHPSWRGTSVGVYRLWRDLGYALGALLAGLLADALGIRAAVWGGAVLTGLSGAVALTRLRETRGRGGADGAPL